MESGQMKSLKGLPLPCTLYTCPSTSRLLCCSAGGREKEEEEEEREEREGAGEEKKAPAGAASVPGPGPPCPVYSAVLSHPLIHPLYISLPVLLEIARIELMSSEVSDVAAAAAAAATPAPAAARGPCRLFEGPPKT